MGVSKTPTRHISREAVPAFARWGHGNRVLGPHPSSPTPIGHLQVVALADTDALDPRRPIWEGQPSSPTQPVIPDSDRGTYDARCAGTPRSPRRPQEAPLQVAAADNTGRVGSGPPDWEWQPSSPTHTRHPRPRSGTSGGAVLQNAESASPASHHPLANRARRGTRISGRHRS